MQDKRLTYMYILDSILKNVQGSYVQLFEHAMPQVLQVAFASATTDDEKKAFIKLFKVWEIFLQPGLLEKISSALRLSEDVSTRQSARQF